MTAFELQPLDTLFFRDARPMQSGAGSGGHGANWPLPTVVHEALRAALLRQAGPPPSGKSVPGHLRGHGGRRPMIVTTDFRSLRTRGPFPVKEGTLYLPTPADVVLVEGGDPDRIACELMVPLSARQGACNLPEFLRPVASKNRSGKTKPPEWMPRDSFCRTLSGMAPAPWEKPGLWETEHRTGIGLDDTTGTVEEGKLYAAEHLRLREGVRLWVEASLSESRAGEENRGLTIDCLRGSTIALGGESRMVRVTESAPALDIPTPAPGKYVKWVLATHAVFCGGWRPNWVDDADGRVCLKKGDTLGAAGGNRKERRMSVRAMPGIRAKLVAVRCEKPIYFSGWDLGDQGPKPTMAAVPAGSVYYFEVETPEDGSALVAALHGRARSDFFGEKGMGLGFCGTWEGP